MTPNESLALFNGISQWAEAITGMRNQLINNGFSPKAAELIVLEALRLGRGQGNV